MENKITKNTIYILSAIIYLVAYNLTTVNVFLATAEDMAVESIKEAVITPQSVIPRATEPTAEQVQDEIIRQSELFGVDSAFMLDLAYCESKFDYKAKNKNSTARGVFQYLINTWEGTESARQGKERNDYEANIREAMIDIANGEYFRWQECLDVMGN